MGSNKYRIDRLSDPWHVFRGIRQNTECAHLVLGPRRYQLVNVFMMKVERLFIAPGIHAAHDEFHTPVIDRASQSNSLSIRETIQLNQLLSDECPLPVIDVRLPLGI